ncbi:MAG TPA: hypothetical protein VHM89_03895 [Acidimicrobiales bacterium]|nr:hypothetical protein [Acidimicrobiales bacterium]
MSVSALSLPAVAHPVGAPLPPDPLTTSAELKLLGHNDLGGKGNHGEVAVLGTTAIVAGGIQGSGGLRTHMYTPYPCAGNKVRLVDISNPYNPTQVAKISVPLNQTARDVAAIKVKAMGVSPTTYKLLAVALTTCGATGSAQDRGLEFYNITNPAAPVFLGRYVADKEQFAAVAATGVPGPTSNGLLYESNYDTNFKSASIELLDPGVANSPLTVNVSNPGPTNPPSAVVVSLATDAGGAITSTAAQVRTAINANLAAKSLLLVSISPTTGSGSGVVTATAAQTLAVPANSCAVQGDCASSMDSVSLAQMPDGRVIATGTEPFASASNAASCDNGPLTFANGTGTFPNCPFPSGDLRIVDATDPTNPVQVGDFTPRRSDPAGAAPISSENPAVNGGFSRNGCRTFTGIMSAELNKDGSKAVAADMDDGLISLAVPARPAGPAQFSEGSAANLNAYVDPAPAADRDTEGNSSFATFADNDNLALLSDQDWIGAESSVVVASSTGGPVTPGSYKACEAHFTLFAPNDTTQVYRHLDSQVPGGLGNNAQFVYAGRGCPSDPLPKTWTDTNANNIQDPGETQFVDLTGKIAVVDRNRSPLRFGGTGPTPASCGASDKTVQMAINGAIAVVVDAQQAGGYAFAFDGAPAGQTIPMVTMDRPAADNLIVSLCRDVVQTGASGTTGNGVCVTSDTVTGRLVDSAPTGGRSLWGAMHVIDLNTNAQVGEYRTPRSQQFPPPDLGVYSVHHAVAKGKRAYVAWNSDGLRVLDLTNPSSPVETGHFIAAAPPYPGGLVDPNGILPTQSYVVGVAIAGPNPYGGCNIAVTDIHAGLWIVRDAGAPAGTC